MGTDQNRSRLLRERRGAQRFPICASVHYKVLGMRPTILRQGATVNISSAGIQFTTEDRIPIGCSVEVSVDWPATIDGCALSLLAWGEVVRSADDWAAMQIESHEFRTRGTRLAGEALSGPTSSPITQPDARRDRAREPRVPVR
jgi:hypothetical protein